MFVPTELAKNHVASVLDSLEPRRIFSLCAILATLALFTTLGVAAAAPRRDTLSILQELGGKKCPDSEFTCIQLDVPLNHFSPNGGRTIPVSFAVLPASGARKGMFVTATGGPGISGIAVADYYTTYFAKGIREHFDIVFFDQRGVRLSGGLTCPDAAAEFYESDWRGKTPAQEAALKASARRFAHDCDAEMNHSDILRSLGTRQAVEDLDQFREMMQDDKIWLYGESYGTQYAQTYAAAHSDHLAGLILDGTVDLTRDGITFYSGEAQAFNDVLVETMASCGSHPKCAANFGGDPISAYDRLAAELDKRATTIQFPLDSGERTPRPFALTDLETATAGQIYNETDRMILTRALAAYARDDNLIPLARLLYLNLGVDPQTLEPILDDSYSDAMFYGVECQDYGYFTGTSAQRADKYLRVGDTVEANIPRLASIFYGDMPCAYWRQAARKDYRPAPLVAEGVPTLVLGAVADPATPVDNGIAVYSRLADGYLITQQGGPHVIFGRGNACPDDIVTAFLVRDRAPASRELECPGVVVDPYVPIARADARAFATPLDALQSAETEIIYLPEFYYWDVLALDGAGCGEHGAFFFTPEGNGTQLMLRDCAFSRGFVMNGTGSYDWYADRFTLDVNVTGYQNCNLHYSRNGNKVKLVGECQGQNVTAENQIESSPLSRVKPHRLHVPMRQSHQLR